MDGSSFIEEMGQDSKKVTFKSMIVVAAKVFRSGRAFIAADQVLLSKSRDVL